MIRAYTQKLAEKAGLSLLHRLDPERAHELALLALRMGLVPSAKASPPELSTELAGLHLPNPVGLAAGFDKNARAALPLLRAGFGFVELGAVTPLPQPGNPRPRLFRLAEDRAIINRFGFNNDGCEAIAARLERARSRNLAGGIIGINLGAGRDSKDRAGDYSICYERLGGLVDFATINISSPNTKGLRDLARPDALRGLLEEVFNCRERTGHKARIFLKLSPDLSERELENICNIARALGIDALIATNTTLARKGLISRHQNETGGLSGRPLHSRSLEIIKAARAHLGADFPIIGVGGIDSAETALATLRAGANAIQTYSGLVYEGFALLDEIKSALLRERLDPGIKP